MGLRCAEGVPFRPADLARGHSSPPPEVPREMALVRKTSRQGYFRQRSMCLSQHVFHMFQAPPQQIGVRRYPHRLVECPSKMVGGKPCHSGQSVEAHLFIEMPFNILANTALPGVLRRFAAFGERCAQELGSGNRSCVLFS